MRWTDWLYSRTNRTDSFALARLMELLFEFLTGDLKLDSHEAARVLWRDYQRGGRRDKPAFLKPFLAPETPAVPQPRKSFTLPKRQARHLV